MRNLNVLRFSIIFVIIKLVGQFFKAISIFACYSLLTFNCLLVFIGIVYFLKTVWLTLAVSALWPLEHMYWMLRCNHFWSFLSHINFKLYSNLRFFSKRRKWSLWWCISWYRRKLNFTKLSKSLSPQCILCLEYNSSIWWHHYNSNRTGCWKL